MTHPISFAVIGCGRIGLRHIEMIKNLPGATLAAVCDVLPVGELGISVEVPYYTSAEAMLAAHPQLDVVAIATPNGFTRNMPFRSLRRGHTPSLKNPWP